MNGRYQALAAATSATEECVGLPEKLWERRRGLAPSSLCEGDEGAPWPR
jgi:hypothetical protein